MGNSTKWTHPRHRVVTAILRIILGYYCRIKYNLTVIPFKNPGNRPHLILLNHQTGFDQFFIAATFRGPIYYVASEDIFSLGWVSDVIRYLVAPIPIKKQTTDLQAVKTCIKVAREGGSICIAPEGNRTYHGRTVYMKPGIASLARKLGMPIAFVRLEGGYGVQPRWSDVVRRGKMRCYVSRVLEPEEFSGMTNDQLMDVIRKELWVDEAVLSGQFRHRKNAEFLERAMYVCPHCGLSTFESHDDIITCKSCSRQIRHLPTKELEGVGFEFPFRFVAQWFDYQNDFVNQLDPDALTQAPVYDETARLSLVHPNKRKELLNPQARVQLYGDRVVLDGRVIPMEELSAASVLGRNKLNLYVGKEILQLKGSKRFNALKYVNFYHRYKNSKAGDNNVQFLGF